MQRQCLSPALARARPRLLSRSLAGSFSRTVSVSCTVTASRAVSVFRVSRCLCFLRALCPSMLLSCHTSLTALNGLGQVKPNLQIPKNTKPLGEYVQGWRAAYDAARASADAGKRARERGRVREIERRRGETERGKDVGRGGQGGQGRTQTY